LAFFGEGCGACACVVPFFALDEDVEFGWVDVVVAFEYVVLFGFGVVVVGGAIVSVVGGGDGGRGGLENGRGCGWSLTPGPHEWHGSGNRTGPRSGSRLVS